MPFNDALRETETFAKAAGVFIALGADKTKPATAGFVLNQVLNQRNLDCATVFKSPCWADR